MIKVYYNYDDNKYTYLKVSGHADYADEGKDLICASVSSITYGLINALDELKDDNIIIQDNKEDTIVEINGDNQVAQNYMQLVMMQLKTIEFSYGEFIQIKERK